MATIVERPLSAFSDPMPSAVVPQRRRRDSVEIIDVDSFEETNTRPQQRRRVEEEPERNIIELLDSDDEPSGDSNVTGGSGASREGRWSSPFPLGVRARWVASGWKMPA
jgi:hypothetical protein